ncbi:MAG: polymer-forming cytoskeletal protein [bacterium]
MARQKFDKGVTLIAPHTEVVGDVSFSDQLYVAGKVTGNVVASGEKATLVVSEEGCVAGEVRVPNIIINGLIEGNVYASNKVELAPQAKVKGNLYYKLIEMQLGALVDGQLVHEEDSSEANVHKLNVDANAEG